MKMGQKTSWNLDAKIVSVEFVKKLVHMKNFLMKNKLPAASQTASFWFVWIPNAFNIITIHSHSVT